MRYQLRPCQLDAVERARKAIRAGRRRPLVVAPTGSGKTVIASHIVESAVAKGRRTLFLAHRLELIEQASRKLDEIGIDHGIIKSGHPRARPDAPVQVASVQTLARPTRSRSLWKQMCGRALRPAPEIGKSDCLILDHAGCWRRHGFLTDPERYSLEGKEKRQSEAPMATCPHCQAEFPGWPRSCPECGEELPRRDRDTSHDPEGELEEMIECYQSLAKMARARGYQPVWVGLEFKKRYDMWPKRRHMGDDPRLVTGMVRVNNRWQRMWIEEVKEKR